MPGTCWAVGQTGTRCERQFYAFCSTQRHSCICCVFHVVHHHVLQLQKRLLILNLCIFVFCDADLLAAADHDRDVVMISRRYGFMQILWYQLWRDNSKSPTSTYIFVLHFVILQLHVHVFAHIRCICSTAIWITYNAVNSWYFLLYWFILIVPYALCDHDYPYFSAVLCQGLGVWRLFLG